jgi:cobyric acid synthase
VSAFLSYTDLVVLTGYKRSADQIRWLREKGIPHTVNAKKRPVVRADLGQQAPQAPQLGMVR